MNINGQRITASTHSQALILFPMFPIYNDQALILEISISFSYDINRGKNTHSRYVAFSMETLFYIPSPRPSLHVPPFIHEIPANYDKNISDGRSQFIQVNRLSYPSACSPAHQSLNEQGNRHADPIQSKDYYIPVNK
jgi:hypothetical protein